VTAYGPGKGAVTELVPEWKLWGQRNREAIITNSYERRPRAVPVTTVHASRGGKRRKGKGGGNLTPPSPPSKAVCSVEERKGKGSGRKRFESGAG